MRRIVFRLPVIGFTLTAMLAIVALPLAAQTGAKNGEWRTYGGDLGNTHYSPLNKINASNFNKLKIAWRFHTDNLGPRPEYNLESTPLVVKGVMYSTAGTRRSVVAVDAATGELTVGSQRKRRHRVAVGFPSPSLGPRPRVLDRWARGTHTLRDARLPPGRAGREDTACR